MGLDEIIRRMPKVELHTHLLGSMRPATFAELAERERRLRVDRPPRGGNAPGGAPASVPTSS